MRKDLIEAFHHQAVACRDLGSPFMARLMLAVPQVFPEGGALAARLDGWQGDLGPSGASLPLRLAGGLHHLVLTGQDAALASVWPPQDGAGLEEVVGEALRRQDGFLTEWVTHVPQTNEVGRSAVLLAAAAEVARWSGLPLVLSELGASAGLNLNFPVYALEIGPETIGAATPALTLRPDWSGRVPPAGPVAVAGARGVDLNPLSPGRDGLRLMSYVWPDQAARLARLEAALQAAATRPPQVDAGDAAGWLEARLATPWPGVCHMVYHTIAFQYFPPETKARITAAMEAAGAQATAEAPLVWVAMEADEVKGSAGVTLRLWPGERRGERRVTLGRAGFHGQWVDWAGL